MTIELLLGRRLLEALVDPDASRAESDGAGIEFAELAARLSVEPGHTLPIETFDGMRSDDLSPSAWLYLLENRAKEEPEIPFPILHDLFTEHSDPAVRFRLIRGALSQPRVRNAHLDRPIGSTLKELPNSFPRQQIEALTELALEGEGPVREEAARALVEIALYLLQDGSYGALVLAAAAITPNEDWRIEARQVVGATIRTLDQESKYAVPFREVPFEGFL